jgi:hypothetical protein
MLHMQLAVRAPIYHAKLAGILYAVRSSFASIPWIYVCNINSTENMRHTRIGLEKIIGRLDVPLTFGLFSALSWLPGVDTRGTMVTLMDSDFVSEFLTVLLE